MSDLGTWGNSPHMKLNGVNPIAQSSSRDRNILTRLLSHKHMIETLERFEWKNLPKGLTSDLIERVLYFRFKGAMFKHLDRYFFLPFTLKGDIDSYGRYIGITPVLFTGQWKMAGDGKVKEDIVFMSNHSYKVVYDLPEEESDLEMIDVDVEEFKSHAVILTDSSLEVSQDYTPMEYLIRPIIEQQVDILVLVNIDLINSAKVYTVIAPDEATKESIEREFNGLDNAILNGKRVIVTTSALDIQQLKDNGQAKDTARYFQSYQSIDNLRKDIIGISNGGTFTKQEHMTQMETETNSSGSSLVLNNALRMRNEWSKIVNKVFGLNIECVERMKEETQVVAPEGSQTKDRKGEDNAI